VNYSQPPFWFYGAHRLLHTKWLYRFHVLHHRSIAPTVWSNDSIGLVDTALSQGFYALIVFIVVASFINTWIQARMTGAPVTFLTLLSMKLRRVPISLIVQSRITAVKAGIPLTTDQLEAHYLAGGDVNQVVRALIAAEKANLNLGFNQAAAIDLATHQSGKSVFEAVMTSVNPKVIDCPNPASGRGRKIPHRVPACGVPSPYSPIGHPGLRVERCLAR